MVFRRIATVLMVLALAGLFVFIIGTEKKQSTTDQQQAERYELHAQRYSEYVSLYNRLSNTKSKALTIDDYSHVFFLCSDCSENVYGDLGAALERNDIRPLLLLTEKSYPGEEECISLEQYKTLLERGWMPAVSYSAKLSDMVKRVKEDSGVAPVAVYFTGSADEWNADVAGEIAAQGINIVLFDDSLPDTVNRNTDTVLWCVPVCGLSSNSLAEQIGTSELPASICYGIGYNKQAHVSKVKQLKTLLTDCATLSVDRKLRVTDAADLDANAREMIAAYNEGDTPYNEYISQLEGQIEAIKTELDTM